MAFHFYQVNNLNYSSLFKEYLITFPLRLTSLRKEVLYILWSANKPLKAYEILDSLLQTKPNSTPPTVYRALMFFISANVVHKIESIQSYTLCSEPEKHLPSEILMVCNDCHQVIEIYDANMRELVANIARNNNFHLKQDVIELKGSCRMCVENFKLGQEHEQKAIIL